MEAGGERYEYIPCLNAEPVHIEMMQNLITTQASDWLGGFNENPEATAQRAIAMGSKA